MAEPVAIVSTGMITPIGLDTAQTVASVRAGISGFEETTIIDKALQPLVMATLPNDVLPDLSADNSAVSRLTFRERRLLQLAQAAIDEALQPLAGRTNAPPLFLGLPDNAHQSAADSTAFSKCLMSQTEDRIQADSISCLIAGRAAGLQAVVKGLEAVRSGGESYALIGGVDSYLDLYLLGKLDVESRINSVVTMDGFVPGEGAAILLLASKTAVQTDNLTPLAWIAGGDVGEEPGHMYSQEPYRGDGLAETITRLFSHTRPPSGSIKTVYCSMNGENHFAKEWGVAYLRNNEVISEECLMQHPADCLGDTGACSGPLMVALAGAGLNDGTYLDEVLVYASSDGPLRSACLLTARSE